jgi:CubicO group peptidase (beta-lactamase class C family)
MASLRIPSLVTRCRVPRDLESVITINRRGETKPAEVGVDPLALERVWQAVQSLYRSGIHPAIQICVRRHGRVILDRAIGHARGNGPHAVRHAPKVLATPETPFNIYSASKAVTAMVVHLLDQEHRIHLDDPVCEYIPEFGCHRKEWITIRHVLTHRAGIPNVPPEAMDLRVLERPDELIGLLCAAQPSWRPGRVVAYHAITGGFILGEIVRRVTGKDIRTFLRQRMLQPLGFRWMSYGVKMRDVPRVAVNYLTGPPGLPPISTMITRALGADFDTVIRLTNDPRFLTAIVPAGNVVATANELSRFYQLLLNHGELDGVRIFEPRTIRRATAEQSYFEFDFSLGLPLRYGMGFMLGAEWFSLYGPDTQQAFGHLGFTNIVGWADPERQVAAAIMTSGKPLIYSGLYYAFDIMRQIGTACAKVSAKRRAPSRARAATRKRAAR